MIRISTHPRRLPARTSTGSPARRVTLEAHALAWAARLRTRAESPAASLTPGAALDLAITLERLARGGA